MVCPTGPGSPFDTARGKPGSCKPCEHGVEILLEAREGRIEQLSAWDDHEIDPAERQRRHSSENLSNQSFSPISPDRIPQLFRRDDAEAGSVDRPLGFARDGPPDHEHGEEASPAALAAIENLLELPSLPEPPALVEPGLPSEGWSHGYTDTSGMTRLRRGDREAFPSLGATPLQHLTPLLGAHAHEKPMRARATLAIRLKRSFTLGHDVGSPATASENQRNLNSSVPSAALSTKRPRCKAGFVGAERVCYSHVPCEP
jgi:hypothetical protein